MPSVGSGDYNRINLWIIQHLSKILHKFRLVVMAFYHNLRRRSVASCVGVTNILDLNV